MSVKYSKTNALRRLDTMRVPYTVFSYDGKDGAIDGKSVCKKIGQDAKHFYKTLVTVGRDKEVYIFVIPILEELDLKKAADVAAVKSLQFVAVKELVSLTGYERGGCSPIGMKKKYKIFADLSIQNLKTVLVSGGRIGIVIQIAVPDFISVCEVEVANLTL